MERPAIFKDITRSKQIVEAFYILLNLERRGSAAFTMNGFCREIATIKYVRCKEFDNLCNFILFNIHKGKGIKHDLKVVIYCFLKSIDPMYLVDFFSILPPLAFGRMRIIFSEDNMIDILKKLHENGMVCLIEDKSVAHEIEKFLWDCQRQN